MKSRFTLTLHGPLAEMVLRLAAARGISEQDAVRLLVGNALGLNHGATPGDSSSLEATPASPRRLQAPAEPARGVSASSLPLPTPPVLKNQESPLSLTLSPLAAPKAAKRGKTAEGEPEFEEFYRAYPRKDCKADAAKAWRQMAGELPPLPDLLASLTAQIKAKGWDTDKQFCPLPASWLRGKRWRDEAAANGNGRLRFGPAPDIRRTAGAHTTPQPSLVKRYDPNGDPNAPA